MAEVSSLTSENEPSESSDELNVAIDISPDKDGKLMKTIIRQGHGWQTPINGDKVSVHYVGKLLDGTQFDSSRERNEEFEFKLGGQEVIQGWEIAVKTMKRGEIASFQIDSSLAYGESGHPPSIPPKATLVFEIELFDWKLEDITKKKDGGVLRRIVKEGEGWDTPNIGSTCRIEYSGLFKDQVFETREVTFYLGEGSEENLVPAIEVAVRKMKKGERCEIVAKPQYVFGESKENATFNIPDDYAEIKYEILLKSFENVKETYEMDNSERIEQAILVKTKGTKYFKEGKYKLAVKQYKRVLQYLAVPEDFDGDLKPKVRETLLAGYLNLAMCYLKLENYTEARRKCDKALEIDSKNEKGLFRRGQANFGLKEYEMSKSDFLQLLQVDPTNNAAKSQIINCNAKIKEHKEMEKKRYKNMFATFAKQDSAHQVKSKGEIVKDNDITDFKLETDTKVAGDNGETNLTNGDLQAKAAST